MFTFENDSTSIIYESYLNQKTAGCFFDIQHFINCIFGKKK